MALLFCDGFDNYGSKANMERSRWYDTISAVFPPGRFQGQCVRLKSGYLALGANLEHLVLGCGFKESISASYPTCNIDFGHVTDVASACVRVTINASSGVAVIYKRINTGSVSYPIWSYLQVASSLPGSFPPDTWVYLELKLDKDDGVEVRLNGETPVSYSGTLSDTQSEGAISMVNFAISSIAGDNRIWLDDLYVLDGATGPGSRPMTDFLGDKRVATLCPSANHATQWTPVSEVTFVNSQDQRYSYTIQAGRTYLPNYLSTTYNESTGQTERTDESCIIARQDCTLKSVTLYVADNVPGVHVRPVLYAEDPVNLDNPKSLLAVGDETTGLAAGSNVIAFGSTAPQLTKGVKYWIGIIADASFSIRVDSTLVPWRYNTGTYPSPPSEFNWVASSSTGYSFVMDYTIETGNYGMVQEDEPNELTYNTTSTVGDKDLFELNATLASDAVVYAVQVSGSFRKDDADPRSIANLIQSGATEAEGESTALNADFSLVSDLFVLNPATSAEWTPAEVNAAQIGYKVSS